MKDFVHLHLHTEYSLLDGFSRIKKGKTSPIVERLKELGMTSCAITDHGNMYGVYPFVEMLEKENIKPIIGSEFYTCADMTIKTNVVNAVVRKNERSKGTTYNHLILIAKTQEGYQNLMRLSSLSFTEGFYGKPRVDLELIERYSKGLICLSACIQGAIPIHIINGEYDKAKEYALNLKRIFKDDFYIEVQYHGIADQKYCNPYLIKLAEEIGVELVATNDVHYLTKEDADVQDVMMCISMQTTVSNPDRIKLEPQEFYLKSYDEMTKMLPEEIYGKALDNTVVIANKCDVKVMTYAPEGHYEIPQYVPENGETPEDYLRDMAYANLEKKYPNPTKEVYDRIKMELDVIIKMGFAGYYLIVWDFINYAKTHGVPVGPGRGSGVGSIVAYLVGITDVEPLRYNLLFERFLNPERVSMPDFDVDFCIEGRGKVIEYVAEKYGKDNVTQIISYGTLSAKAVVKDVARAYEINYNDADKWSKSIPNTPKITIDSALGITGGGKDASPDFIKFYNEDATAKMIIDMARKLEGLPRQTGMHAAGVLICPGPVYTYLPMQMKEGSITTQFDKDQVEHMGLVKMDFLGLRTLTDINLALEYVKEDCGKDIDFDKMELNDPDVYREISSGDTEAIFQVENAGIRKFMSQLAPDRFEEVIAGVALYRPGPMQFTGTYIKGKKNPKGVVYADPKIKPILEETYGCIVYQEQVMQLARFLAGYTYGGADELRRAMGKKKKDVMAAHREIFVHGRPAIGSKPAIDGTHKRGIPDEVAYKLFDDIAIFAEYAFNKSHAAAYSVLTYQTAFLKKYYPVQFMTAILNNRITDAKEVSKYVNYLNGIGVKMLPPNINKSNAKFSTENGGVRFGLMAIKNVGEGVVREIIYERLENGEYTDLEDLINRNADINLNKRMLENMIKGGAFDCFGHTRSCLLASYEQILAMAAADKKHKATGQLSLFDAFSDEAAPKYNYPEVVEFNETEKLLMEKEVLGMYTTGHPLNSYRKVLDGFFAAETLIQRDEDVIDDEANLELDEEGAIGVNYDKSLNNRYVTMGGVIANFEKKVSKKSGKNMGYGTLEDLTGSIELVCFSDAFEKYRDLLYENSFVKVEGTLDIPDNDKPKIRVRKIEVLPEPVDVLATKLDVIAKPKTLYLNLDAVTTPIAKVIEVIEQYSGDSEVIAKIGGAAKKFRQSVSICDGLLLDLEVLLGDKNIRVK